MASLWWRRADLNRDEGDGNRRAGAWQVSETKGPETKGTRTRFRGSGPEAKVTAIDDDVLV